jgi:Xaa-Pro aminopeptidase
MQEPGILIDRRRRLVETLPAGSLAIVPPSSSKTVSADASSFSPSRNLYYLGGIDQEDTWLLMYRPPSGENVEVLFVDPFDPEYERWYGRKLTVDEARERSGVRDVRTDKGWRGAIERLLARYPVEAVYVDYPLSGLGRTPGTRQRFALELRDAYPHIRHARLSDQIHRMRMIKEPCEIDAIRKAIDITGAAFRSALKELRPGTRECEFEAELAKVILASGAEHAFPVIAAGGPRATCLHYAENAQVLENGWMLLVDFGAMSDWYACDITRTVPVNGRYTDRQRMMVDLVIEIQHKAIELLRPGITLAQWNIDTRAFYAGRLVECGLIQAPEEIDKVYYHNGGHHLGLDTHDEAVTGAVIEPGMVLTVEPGLYVASEGFGIRIEDDVLVGAGENTVLSSCIPKEPREIEELMGGRAGV